MLYRDFKAIVKPHFFVFNCCLLTLAIHKRAVKIAWLDKLLILFVLELRHLVFYSFGFFKLSFAKIFIALSKQEE